MRFSKAIPGLCLFSWLAIGHSLHLWTSPQSHTPKSDVINRSPMTPNTTRDRNLILYGEPRADSTPISGQVGPLSFVFEEGMLKHLRIGSVEVARRVYFAVRNKDWDTVKNVISDVRIDQTPMAFVATWMGRCQRGSESDYVWKGRLEILSDGIIRFAATGSALKEFSTPRVGLCLLLSFDATKERAFEVTHLDGQKRTRVFQTIFPRTQPASRWTSLRFSPSDGIQAEYSIEGSYFDLEDQRNFGDVTYKAMAGMPYTNEIAKAGQEMGQTLTVRISAPKGAMDSRESGNSQPVILRIGSELVDAKVPMLGVKAGSELGELSRVEIDLLRQLPGFLDIALQVQKDDLSKEAERVSKLMRETKKPISLTVHELTSENQHAVTQFLKQLKPLKPGVLELRYAGSATPDLALLRACARDAGIEVPIGKLAVGDFQERASLVEASQAKADFLAWSSTPISHQDDDETLMENASVYCFQNQTARGFAPGIRISVGPIEFDRHGYTARPDTRYTGLIAAAFVANSIKSLGEGATSLATFFDAVGPEGHIYRKSRYPLPYYDRLNKAQVFPSYHVLRILGSWSGRQQIEVGSSDSLRIESFATRHGNIVEIAIVNRSPRSQRVVLEGRTLGDGLASVVSLDESTFAQGHVVSDEKLQDLPSTNARASNGRLSMELSPYAVTIVRATELE